MVFNVIDLNALEIHRTHLVHRNLQTVKLENLVRVRSLIFERHVVLETRAAAANHSNAQRDRNWALHVMISLTLVLATGVKLIIIPLGLRSQAHLRC